MGKGSFRSDIESSPMVYSSLDPKDLVSVYLREILSSVT